MKIKLIEIFNDYKNDFKALKEKIKYFFSVMKDYFHNLKNNFKEQEKRKKYFIGSGILAVFSLLLLGIFSSFAYYRDTNSIPLIHATVGDIYTQKFDYVLRVYLENVNEANKYHLTDGIPSAGYSYSGYKCQKDSILNYNSELKKVSTTFNERDVCSIYFNLISDLDIVVNVMLEEDVGSNTYILGNNIPPFGYKYSHYECENNNKLEYDSNLHKVTLQTSKKDTCSIYFTKYYSDVTIRLFVENNKGLKDYVERVTIPSNEQYSLNEEKSSCTNNNNERIDANITYNNGYIETEVKEMSTCEIYLDKYE